jgi:hypothetical protein
MAVATAVLAGVLLVVPPPRPVAPSSNAAAAPLQHRDFTRRDRALRGALIGSAITAGVGLLALCFVAVPGDVIYQRELSRAQRAWDFDDRRAHLDRARAFWPMRRAGLIVGLPLFAVGTISTIVLASVYRRLVLRRNDKL